MAETWKLGYVYLHPVWLEGHEESMVSTLGLLEVHQHAGLLFLAGDVQMFLLVGSDAVWNLAFHYEFELPNFIHTDIYKFLAIYLILPSYISVVNERISFSILEIFSNIYNWKC